MLIKFTITPEKTKEGEIRKDEKGNIVYMQHDVMGILMLTNYFDSRNYGLDKYRIFIKLKDDLIQCFKEEKQEIELSLDKASFLKDYLKDLGDNKKVAIPEFQLRTLVSILDVLDKK